MAYDSFMGTTPSGAWSQRETTRTSPDLTGYLSYEEVSSVISNPSHRAVCGELSPGPVSRVGWCVLDADHPGLVHEAENGTQWNHPGKHRRPSSVWSGFVWGFGVSLGILAGTILGGIVTLLVLMWGGL